MISIKVNKEELEIIRNDFKDVIVEENVGFIIFCAKNDEYIVTAYNNNKKDNFTVTIQGEDPLPLAKKYTNNKLLLPKKKKIIKESPFFVDVDKQIGSDEVGTGDFLAPIVVCASFVNHETMKIIDALGLKDSKQMTNEQIFSLIPTIKKKVHYECKILPNEKYNALIEKGFNMVQIKVIMHNYVLSKLHQRCPYVKNVYMDQFVEKDKYYSYLITSPVVEQNIVFREKGESFFPSVALASCIARYCLLEDNANLSKKYKMKIPLGAGVQVDEFAKKFIEKYGIEEFKKIAKINFKNYDRAIDDK